MCCEQFRCGRTFSRYLCPRPCLLHNTAKQDFFLLEACEMPELWPPAVLGALVTGHAERLSRM